MPNTGLKRRVNTGPNLIRWPEIELQTNPNNLRLLMLIISIYFIEQAYLCLLSVYKCACLVTF